jgi:glyoxylase-like metal-dependent hydrolase (beta-lactamase superfamily II)
MIKDTINCLVLGTVAANCWIIPLAGDGPPDKPGACVLIDPGDQADLIIARLNKLVLRPQYILLTHGHFDHVAALPGLFKAFGPVPVNVSAKTGPAPEVAIHREDAHYLGPDSYRVHYETFDFAGDTAYVEKFWKPLPAPTRLLSDGELIGPFRVLHLPGHTPGSVGFFMEAEKLLFSGDTLFKAGMGRTDLPGGNFLRLQQSLRRLFTLDEDVIVYPGHGPATTIGDEWFDMA